jgi:hypothetical protein
MLPQVPQPHRGHLAPEARDHQGQILVDGSRLTDDGAKIE